MPTQDWEQKAADTWAAIEDSGEISDRNTELIREYKREKVLKGLSQATLSRNLTRLKILAEHLDEPLDELDRDGIKDLVEWLYEQDYTESTVNTYKNVIRSFYRWKNGGEIPDKAAWIKMNNAGKNDTLPKDLLTKEDIQKQIEAATNPRDKALIAMLYETGARIGELIDLTVGDIEDRQHGKKVVIDGKTGPRRLPLVESVPHLNRWLGAHPNPEKDAPLWSKIQQGSSDDQLGYRYIADKILKKTMERAGIDKPANPHHYRHSRASDLATELKEAQLCEWFGWVQGSDVPAKYVHLSGRDIDNAYDQLHGLSEPEEEDNGPDVIECPRCDQLNEPDDKFCGRCGFALDTDAQAIKEDAEADLWASKGEATADEDEALDKLKALIDEHPELVAELG